ncbi:MAG: hypothetical protein H6625_11945 [Bdellovibrionaceae bacterium]|nr:hypothetical protein [Pseudobdellovibrionaceae bacterium]
MKFLILSISLLLSFYNSSAWAVGSGFSLGANIGLAGGGQTDMNKLITSANSRESGLSVSELGNAWDVSLMFTYKVTNMIALQFRPSMYYVSQDGSNANGKFEYSVLGFNIFPVLRLYLLENNYIAFFTNIGVGWGFANGEVKEATDSLEFSGSNLGYMLGLGAEFCFFGSSHCMNIEGNLRYVDIERVIGDSATGAFTGSPLTQASKSNEVEINGRDLGLRMSGIVGSIGYIYYF